MSNQGQLKRELLQAGAKPSEVAELTHIAVKLRKLRTSPTNDRRWVKVLKPAGVAFGIVAVVALIVTRSQSVTPTSWLYPVQQASDTVAIGVHPQYRATTMMRSARQVNELVATHASSQVILATLYRYEAEATAYKAMPHADYAAFDYCKANLEHAEATASPTVRQAIASSLESLSAT